MVGFGLIVILVSVILVILLAVVMYSKKNVEIDSAEVNSFIASLLVYTTDCSSLVQRNMPIQKLIAECVDGKQCIDGRESCAVLNETVNDIVKTTWNKENRPVRGYDFKISSDNFEAITIKGGNSTSKNSRMSSQDIYLKGRKVVVSLEIFG